MGESSAKSGESGTKSGERTQSRETAAQSREGAQNLERATYSIPAIPLKINKRNRLISQPVPLQIMLLYSIPPRFLIYLRSIIKKMKQKAGIMNIIMPAISKGKTIIC